MKVISTNGVEYDGLHVRTILPGEELSIDDAVKYYGIPANHPHFVFVSVPRQYARIVLRKHWVLGYAVIPVVRGIKIEV